MAVIKLRRGTSNPTTSNTQPYELSYNKNSNQLYVHDGTSIVRVAGKAWRRITVRQNGTSSISKTYLDNAKSILIVLEKDFGIHFRIGQIIIPSKIIIGNSSNTEIDNPNDMANGEGYHSLIWANPDSMAIEQTIVSIYNSSSTFRVQSYDSNVKITIYIDTNH